MHQIKNRSALLIIDMINQLEFPGAEKLLRQALPVAENILRLKQRFNKKKLPVIYVNDNYGLWKGDRGAILARCLKPESRGRRLAKIIAPTEDDYFVTEAKHSGFYLTSLEILLDELKIKTLYVTGIAGNICVLFTAHDAHMREFEVIVPRDCIASNTKKLNDDTVRQLSEGLQIRTPRLVTGRDQVAH